MNEIDYKKMSTENLVLTLRVSSEKMNVMLSEELAGRPESVPLLTKVLLDRPGSKLHPFPENWPVIHAVHVLGSIKTKDSLQALFYAARYLDNELGTYYFSSLPGLLAGFGSKAIDELENIISEDNTTEFSTGIAATALASIAEKYPEKRQEMVNFLSNTIQKNCRKLTVAYAVYQLARIKEKTALKIIKQAFLDNRVDLSLIDEQTVNDLMNGKILLDENPVEQLSWYYTSERKNNLRDELIRVIGTCPLEKTPEK